MMLSPLSKNKPPAHRRRAFPALEEQNHTTTTTKNKPSEHRPARVVPAQPDLRHCGPHPTTSVRRASTHNLQVRFVHELLDLGAPLEAIAQLIDGRVPSVQLRRAHGAVAWRFLQFLNMIMVVVPTPQ